MLVVVAFCAVLTVVTACAFALASYLVCDGLQFVCIAGTAARGLAAGAVFAVLNCMPLAWHGPPQILRNSGLFRGSTSPAGPDCLVLLLSLVLGFVLNFAAAPVLAHTVAVAVDDTLASWWATLILPLACGMGVLCWVWNMDWPND
eukprot:TRINITY_DN4207_c0_g2_i1.p2 TRINITY_DN4207_c0_g2~~TRINITY_DN4207_c0_g2_i1.p2  ORF type:complete len:163 (+),score=51.66 TRINITY_DN4207_c0_g2_i1:52-489(+)